MIVSTNINILTQIYLFNSITSATDLTSAILKFNPNSPTSIAQIYAGGSLTLVNSITRRTFGLNSDLSDTIEFPQELEIPPGQGVCLVHEAESSGLIYTPYVTYYWWE